MSNTKVSRFLIMLRLMGKEKEDEVGILLLEDSRNYKNHTVLMGVAYYGQLLGEEEGTRRVFTQNLRLNRPL